MFFKNDPAPLQHGAPREILGSTVKFGGSQDALASDTGSPELGAGIVTIGQGTRVTGTIDECKTLDVQGVLEGDTVAEMVIVRNGGGIKGSVRAQNAEIRGVVNGALIVHEHLEIKATGDVSGEIAYVTLAIEKGAKFQGTVQCEEEAHEVTSSENIAPPAIPSEDAATPMNDEIFQSLQTIGGQINGTAIPH